ncbi:MAG: YihY/virulence factor BrkB family protein, partial [Treponema sp.]|nr:YihY/virulence factor BrkB family protein [Treponema sp.]
GGNGLTNHAAAGAYGFLLSLAPMLLIVSFFLIRAFRAAPEAAISLLQNIPFLDTAFDEWPALDFLISAPPGIPALISMLSILWAGRIFAVSLHRGLKVVFTGTKKRNPVQDNLVTLGIEFLILIVMLTIILGSRMALRLYDAAGFFPDALILNFIASLFGHRVFQFAAMGFLLYIAYRLIPANPPNRFSAFCGSVFCTIVYGVAAMLLGMLLGQPRYNFLYGTLGDLVILLVNVYFFFLFFFFGAQFAAVTNSFEALLFLRLRETRIGVSKKGRLDPGQRLFSTPDGKLKKYQRFYGKGETILSKGDAGNDIYFLLDGEVEVFIPSPKNRGDTGCAGDCAVSTLKPGSFIGEMSYLLSEDRSATIRTKTDASALALPPRLFEAILGSDTGLDRSIIENLSQRIKKSNEQIAALSGSHR